MTEGQHEVRIVMTEAGLFRRWYRAECSCGFLGVARRYHPDAARDRCRHLNALSNPTGNPLSSDDHEAES